MAGSLTRVLALLEMLESGGVHTLTTLSIRLGVDERTIRRYIAHLLDLGVPVESLRGRYGGYRLTPGYRMPPVMLTDAEALAVALGLVLGRRTALVAAPEVALDSALAKLRRVLPTALAERVDDLAHAVTVPTGARATAGSAPDTDSPTPTAVPDSTVMLDLGEAVRRQRPVRISYANRAGRRSHRILHPAALVARGEHWYVLGDDGLSGESRWFRVDRILSTVLQPGAFAAPDPDLDADAALRDRLASTPWRHEVRLVVDGPAADVAAVLPDGLAVIEPAGTASCRVTIRAERLDWVPGVLARLRHPFRVESPDELRVLLRETAARLAAAAG